MFASNNVTMMGAIDALYQPGGGAVALIGFDEFALADKLDPPVTVVAQDPVAIGATAAQLLFARIDGDTSPPRQVVLFFALTELRLLAGIYGIESIIRKEPDVVLTVSDASKAQHALTGAPGTLRVIDEKTVYLRMPPTFLVPETLLMVLRNLMRAAHERDVKGEEAPVSVPRSEQRKEHAVVKPTA